MDQTPPDARALIPFDRSEITQPPDEDEPGLVKEIAYIQDLIRRVVDRVKDDCTLKELLESLDRVSLSSYRLSSLLKDAHQMSSQAEVSGMLAEVMEEIYYGPEAHRWRVVTATLGKVFPESTGIVDVEFRQDDPSAHEQVHAGPFQLPLPLPGCQPVSRTPHRDRGRRT